MRHEATGELMDHGRRDRFGRCLRATRPWLLLLFALVVPAPPICAQSPWEQAVNALSIAFARLVPKQQILVKRPDLAKVVNLTVDPKSYWLYTSSPYDRERRREAFEQHGFENGLEILAQSGLAQSGLTRSNMKRTCYSLLLTATCGLLIAGQGGASKHSVEPHTPYVEPTRFPRGLQIDQMNVFAADRSIEQDGRTPDRRPLPDRR